MISPRIELSKILLQDKEYNYCIVRHMTNSRCICMTQPPMIFDNTLKANTPNPSYRTIANPDCPNCEGSGWDFDENIYKCIYFIPGFRIDHYAESQYSITHESILTAYLLAGNNAEYIRPNDWFFNIKCDLSGKITTPITRIKKWIITDAYQIRLDSNNVEYTKIFAKPAVI